MENFHHFDNNESQLAPGYRFHPTDEELITYYLVKKVLDSNFMARAIAEVDLNKCEPWELPGKAKMGEKEWYFFSLRDRKYPTGLRTNRATEAGYWKATGKDREIYGSRTGSLLGMKKTLVFYKGRAPKGEKTNWVMHEYRLEGKFSYLYLSTTSKHEWVISRVFHKSGGGGSGKKSRATGSVYKEMGSPSSTSLPPLFESSLFAGMTDQESCSCESDNTREHVPCFSTATAAASANFSFHPFAPPSIIANPMARFGNSRASAFPSLQSLQEKLQQPFFSSVEPPMTSSPLGFEQQNQMGGCSSAGNFPEPEPEQVVARRNRQQLQMGAVELDCLWTC